MSGVERARARVRELTPLLFNFDLPIMPSFQTAPDTNSPFMRAIQDQYNVQIMFRQKQKNFHATTVVVKGCEWECARVKEATLLLMDHLFKVWSIMFLYLLCTSSMSGFRTRTMSDFHDDGSFSPASRHSPGQREHQPQDNHAENKYDHHLPGRRRSKHSPNQERIGDH